MFNYDTFNYFSSVVLLFSFALATFLEVVSLVVVVFVFTDLLLLSGMSFSRQYYLI